MTTTLAGTSSSRTSTTTAVVTDRRKNANLRQAALAAAARSGDHRARDELLQRDLPLVHRIARRHRGSGLPYDDLVQEGALGLLEAIARYDPDRSPDFLAYAAFRVDRTICNALNERARLVRLPRHVLERRRRLARVSAEILAATGRTPSREELAARTDLSAAAVAEAMAAPETMSLDRALNPDGSPLEAVIADATAADPEESALQHGEAELVDEAVAHLPSRERVAIEHAFGFGAPPESIAQVAARLHVSPPRARTIVTHALERLHNELVRA